MDIKTESKEEKIETLYAKMHPTENKQLGNCFEQRTELRNGVNLSSVLKAKLISRSLWSK
jgi:hypothetical protein